MEKNGKNHKVFGIGFHKTGTTSLAMALSVLGYKNNRGLDTLRHLWGLDKCVQLLKEKDYQPFINYIKDFDSTLDNPWYLLYQQLDEAFPNSKFILTERDETKWLNSCKHFFKGKSNPIHELIYKKMHIEGNEKLYQDRYASHLKEVKDYFSKRPNDLLIVDWEKGSGWDELCKFLNKPMINLPFPHANKRK